MKQRKRERFGRGQDREEEEVKKKAPIRTIGQRLDTHRRSRRAKTDACIMLKRVNGFKVGDPRIFKGAETKQQISASSNLKI